MPSGTGADSSEKTPRMGVVWYYCDRCDTQYPKDTLELQDGLLVCSECYDVKDHEGES